MRKRFSRRTALLLIPMIMGTLIGGVRWKQLHPTPTQFDLQEQARLHGATSVNVFYKDRPVAVPIEEFKATLDDFYLLDDKSGDPSSFVAAMALPVYVPYSGTRIILRKDRSKDTHRAIPIAEIGMEVPTSYVSREDLRGGTITYSAKLHPLTRLRLKALIDKYRPAK